MSDRKKHADNILAGILPSNLERLNKAISSLSEDHFDDKVQRNLFKLIQRYYERTAFVLTLSALEDLLRKRDVATQELYKEMYEAYAERTVDDGEFLWSIDQIRDIAADERVGELLADAVEILTDGRKDPKTGELLQGHHAARELIAEGLSAIDRSLTLQDSPEGDLRDEYEEMLQDYAERKKAREEGTSQGIYTGIQAIDAKTGGMQPGELIITAAYSGQGKAQPLTAKVLTPTGYITMGEVEVGTRVCTPSGRNATVTGVFPQGRKKIARITCSNGATTEASYDHLWTVEVVRKKIDRRILTLTTRELEECLQKKSYTVYLPNIERIEFEPEKSLRNEPLPPYEMGYAVGSYSHRKDIPEEYLHASYDERFELLQGLYDSCGYYDTSGYPFLRARRPEILDQFAYLVRSLGFSATVNGRDRPLKLKPNQKFLPKKTQRYTVHMNGKKNLFRNPEMQKKVKESRRRKVRITSVEYSRMDEAQCIMIDDPDHLYITDDFIPTHNTTLTTQTAWYAATQQGKNVVFFTTETLRDQVRRKLIARHSKLKMFGLPDGLNTRDLKAGSLTDVQEAKLKEVVADLTKNPAYGKLYIAQVPRGSSITSLEQRLYSIQRQFHVDFVVIDYLALLASDRRRQTTREELAAIMKEAKQVAATFDNGRGIPLMSPWQVRRESYEQALKNGAYTSAALSETAEATSTSDLIISLLAEADNDSRYCEVSMQILKNRDGEAANNIIVDVDYATATFTSRNTSATFGSAATSPDQARGSGGLSALI